MDKKNTMLLTVIAVATLLVAVVGATFAYFSLTVDQKSNTASIKAGTSKLPTITINGSTATLNLTLTATDMANPESNTNYYAINGDTSNGSQNGGKWAKEPQDLQVGSIVLANGDTGLKVGCQTSVMVTAVGNMVEKLQSGDAFLVLKGYIQGGDQDGQTLDLTSIGSEFTGSKADATRTQTYTGQITLNGASDTKDLKAELYIVNKKDQSQNHLADTSLTVTITSTATCNINSATTE